MAQSYLELVGHAASALYGIHNSGDLAAALQKAGFGKERIAEGDKLAHDAEDLIRRKLDTVGEDRTAEHAIHAASQELEMWMQTVAFRVKKVVEEESAVDLVLAKSLHTHDHTVSTTAKALRMMSMLRCDDRVHARLGGAHATREILNRGHALATKLYRASDIRLAPRHGEEALPIFGDLKASHSKLASWVHDLALAAPAAATKDIRLVGRLGLVPDGVAIPAGGTSRAVVLHERGQTTAPDPNNVVDCLGWSVGRQGRNRENLGRGWTAPEA